MWIFIRTVCLTNDSFEMKPRWAVITFLRAASSPRYFPVGKLALTRWTRQWVVVAAAPDIHATPSRWAHTVRWKLLDGQTCLQWWIEWHGRWSRRFVCARNWHLQSNLAPQSNCVSVDLDRWRVPDEFVVEVHYPASAPRCLENYGSIRRSSFPNLAEMPQSVSVRWSYPGLRVHSLNGRWVIL